MKRVQKDLFFLQDSAAIVFKVFPSESLKKSCVLRDYIELAGGMCLEEEDEDDPFAIPIVDLNFLHANNKMKGFKKPKDDSRDYFTSDYVYDSYLNDKVMDLNKYKMRQLSDVLKSSSYDANQIAKRELRWADVIQQVSSTKDILNKKKASKKKKTQSSQVSGTVEPLLPSQPDPQSSGSGDGEEEDSQIMHPSQNSDDDNKENEFDEMKDSSFETNYQDNMNIEGDGMSKLILDKSIPGDNEEDTGDEIQILEKDAESIQDTPQDNQMDQDIFNTLNNSQIENHFNEDIQSINVSDNEDHVVGDEVPCTSKSLNRNNNSEKESNIIINNSNNNNNTAASKSPVDRKQLEDDSSDEEKNNRSKNVKRKQTNDAHSSKKKKTKRTTTTTRSRKESSSSSSSSSSEDEKEKKRKPTKPTKSTQIENSNDDSSSSSDEAKQSDSDSDYAPKKKQRMDVKLKKKKVKVEQQPERRGVYSYDESVSVLEFINKHNFHHMTGGNLLWRKMKETGKFHRTPQSLKEHFRRTISKDLKFYGCSKENRKKFRDGLKTRKRTAHKTKMYSQDFRNVLEAELSSDAESEKEKKKKKKKKGKSKKHDSESDD